MIEKIKEEGGHDNELKEILPRDGTQNNPHVIANAIHIQNMSKALIEKQTTYFVLSADIDMQGIEWAPLNDANGYHKWIDFDDEPWLKPNLNRVRIEVSSGYCVENVEMWDLWMQISHLRAQVLAFIAPVVGLAAGRNYTGKITNCYTSGTLKCYRC